MNMRNSEAPMLVFIQKGQTHLNRFKIFRESAGSLAHRIYFFSRKEKLVRYQKVPRISSAEFLPRNSYFPDIGINFSLSSPRVFCQRAFANRCQGLLNTRKTDYRRTLLVGARETGEGIYLK